MTSEHESTQASINSPEAVLQQTYSWAKEIAGANLDRLAELEVIAASSLDTLGRAFGSTPPMPGQQARDELNVVTSRQRLRVPARADSEDHDDARDHDPANSVFRISRVAWRMARGMVRVLSRQSEADEKLTVEQRVSMTRRLADVFRGANIDTICARLHSTQNYSSRDVTDRLMAFSCVHAAAFAMTNRDEISPESSANKQEVDRLLSEACQAIRAGQDIVVDKSSPRSALESGALRTLAAAYRVGDSLDFAKHAAAYLGPLYLGTSMPASIHMPALLENATALSRDLRVAGMRVSLNESDHSSKEMKTAIELAIRRRAEYARIVDQIYTQLRLQHFARVIVNGLASGKIVYSQLTEYSNLEASKPLHNRAEQVKQDAIEREARLNDLGWISLELELDPENLLGVVVLPPGEAETERSSQPARARESRQAAEEVQKIEPYRLYALAKIKAMYPGSRVMFKLVARGKAQAEGAEQPQPGAIKASDLERYVVLVLPNGDFIAEYPEPNHATIVYRSISSGREDPYLFEQVLAVNIATAVEHHGAVRVEHPHHADLAANQSAAVNAFIDLLLEDITTPLMPGEKLPDHKRLRRIRKMGSRAASAS